MQVKFIMSPGCECEHEQYKFMQIQRLSGGFCFVEAKHPVLESFVRFFRLRLNVKKNFQLPLRKEERSEIKLFIIKSGKLILNSLC